MGQRSEMVVKIVCLGMRLGVKFSLTLNIKNLVCQDVDIVFGGDVIDADKVRAALANAPTKQGSHHGLGLVCDSLCSKLITAV